MRTLRKAVIAVLAALVALGGAAIIPTAALAQGCNSAGDQQYVDPFQNCGSTAPTPTTSSSPKPVSSTTPSSSGASGPSSQAPTGATSSTPAQAGTGTTATAGGDTTGGAAAATIGATGGLGSAAPTLPYTGLNLWAVVGVGLGLGGSGLLLRRLVRTA